MCEKVTKEAFRSVFKVVNKETLHWFPGHMGRGLKQMQNKLRSVDCIIEVHDSRIPISGRNTDFRYTISGIKPHILVLNKIDLIDKKHIPKIIDHHKNDTTNIIFTNSKNPNCTGIKKLFPLVQNLIQNSDRYNRSGEEDYCVMIIGVPNVGKSSLINALRVKYLNKGGAAPVGASPGITKSVMNKIKINHRPLCYLLDTPGILTPKIPNTEVGLKLALCATLQDHLVGQTIIADYLLFWLNKQKYFDYVKYFQLKDASDDILDVLSQISIKSKKMLRLRNTNNEYVYKPDFDTAALRMIKAFREGHLGNIMLDEDLL